MVGVVTAYLSYADLGMGRVPMREIPLAVGSGQTAQAEEWRFYGLFSKTACAVLAALGLAGYVLLRWQTLESDLRFGLLTACLVLISSAIANEQQVILQADQRFGRLTTLLVASAAVNLVGGIAGALMAGVRGVFVSQVFALAVSAALSVWLAGLPRRLHVRASFLRRLFRAGVPFAVIAFVDYNVVNVDQVMTASLLGSQALGVYTLVLYAGSALALFPGALGVAVGTRLLRRFGEESTTDAIRGLTWRPVAGLSTVMPVLSALVWAGGPWAILWALPAYAPAIGPLRVYVVGAFFLGLNLGTSTALFALNKYTYNIPIVAGCIGLNVVLDLVFVGWRHWGLMGIALGSMCTYCAYWMIHTALVHHYFGCSLPRSILLNLASGWPGLALAALDLVAWASGSLWGPAYRLSFLVVTVFVGVMVLRWRNLTTSRMERGT